MARFALVACLLVFATVVCAQTGNIIITPPNGATSLPVGVQTERIFVYASETPKTDITLTMQIIGDSNPGNCQFNPGNQITLTPTAPQATFRMTCNNATSFLINTTKTEGVPDADAQFATVPQFTIGFVKRNIAVDPFPSASNSPLYVNQPSEPQRLVVQYPPEENINFENPTFYGSGNNETISFSSPITIPAGGRIATFTYSQVVDQPIVDLNFTVTGQSDGNVASFYNSPIRQTLAVPIQLRPVEVISGLTSSIFLGGTGDKYWNDLYLYTRQLVNQSQTLTITPYAADTTFNPTSISLNSNTQIAHFKFNTLSRSDLGAGTYGPKYFYFFLGGDAAQYYAIAERSAAIASVQRVVSVQYPTSGTTVQMVIANVTYMSVRIDAPTPSALTVSYQSANLQFEPASVTFSGNTTSILVKITPIYLGDDTITYTLSNTDNEYFAKPADQAVTVNKMNFITPYYPASYFVGVMSDVIHVRASTIPNLAEGVQLWPTASNLIFVPTNLTFKRGAEQQYFRVIPMYTNAGDASSYSTVINYRVAGVDGANTVYDPPASRTITIQKRQIQAKWSEHLKTKDSHAGGANTRHLHKTYKVWVSLNYILENENVLITPVSPYWSFSPASMNFTSKNTRTLWSATLTGINTGFDSIRFIVGGQDGGLYTPPDSLAFTTAMRPLDIVGAVLSPDERSWGVYVGEKIISYGVTPSDGTCLECQKNLAPDAGFPMATFSPSWLATYHVHNFLIRSFVLPDKDLTIIPHCNHAKFSPSSITLKAKHGAKRIDNVFVTPFPAVVVPDDRTYYFNVTGVYLEANFSVTAQAAGTHDVWFELKGADADYYTKASLEGLKLNFNLVMRPDSEPFRVSSSSFLFPSFVVVVAMAIFSLVM